MFEFLTEEIMSVSSFFSWSLNAVRLMTALSKLHWPLCGGAGAPPCAAIFKYLIVNKIEQKVHTNIKWNRTQTHLSQGNRIFLLTPPLSQWFYQSNSQYNHNVCQYKVPSMRQNRVLRWTKHLGRSRLSQALLDSKTKARKQHSQ